MQNIIEFLQSYAKQKPNATFCVDSCSEYSYKQAYDIVKNIACYFCNKNILKQPILLKAERNNNSLLLMLGIIMSNNYYVPVNPDYSEDKLQSIICSSNIKYAVVFDEQIINNVKCFKYTNVCSFASNDTLIQQLQKNYDKNNFIYTIYTSGSTGKPKGVVKTQQNIISFVNNFKQTFNINNSLHIANQAPLFFDASMKDVFLTLATGSTIYFPNKTLFAMPLQLVEYLNANKIDFVCWVPSALTIMVRLNTFKYAVPQYLKYVMFVGEVFMPKYLNMWLTSLPNIMYVNLYGSTELAGVCLYKIIDKVLDETKPIPLGKPLLNNKIELIDGEIVVDSSQIATGYVNDPDKNAQVFCIVGDKKLLKTGDYAFVNQDGDFVFTSRKDYQIKHMGYRIELQEIDVAVSSLNYVNSCVTLYDSKTDKIIECLSVNKNIDNVAKTVITDLKNIVPAYMVPNKIEVLEELPLNANGKIDRTKLKLKIIGE